MSDNIFLLPQGHDRLSGACALDDWVLAWHENEVFNWSLETGWRKLPSVEMEISSAWVCDIGVLVVCQDESEDQLLLWVPGEDDWCWQCSFPGTNPETTKRFCFAGGFVTCLELSQSIFCSSALAVYFAEIKREMPVWKKVELNGIEPDNSIEMACYEPRGKGLWFVDDSFNIYRKGSIVNGEKFNLVGNLDNLVDDYAHFYGDISLLITEKKIFIYIPDAWRTAVPVLEFGLVDAVMASVGLPYITGALSLLSAFAENNRELVRNIIAALESLPKFELTFGSNRELHDICLDGNVVKYLITSLGIFTVGTVVTDDEYSYDPFLSGKELLLAWKFWLDREKYFAEIVGEIVQGSGNHEILSDTLLTFNGFDCGQQVFDECVRGSEKTALIFDAEGIRRLFRRLGSTAGTLIEKYLQDDDLSAVKVACAAAGAADEDTGHSYIWKTREEIPVERLLELLQSRESQVLDVALETVARLKLVGAMPHISRLMADPDCLSLENVVTAIPYLPGVTADHQLQLEELALNNQDDGVRAKAIWAIAELLRKEDTAGGMTAAIRATADFEWSVRSEARNCFAGKESLLTLEQVIEIVDLSNCVVTASLLLSGGDDDSIDLDDFLDDDHFGLGEILSLYDPEDSDAMVPESLRVQSAGLFLDIAYLFFLKNNSFDIFGEIDDEGNVEEAKMLYDLCKSVGFDRVFDFAGFKRFFNVRHSRLAMAELAVKLPRQLEPEIGNRLAVLVNAGLSEVELTKINSNDAGVNSGYVPLHLRLQSMTKTPDVFKKCHELTKSEAEKHGLRALAARFSLLVNGEAGALEQLKKSLIDGENAEYDLPVLLCLKVIKSDRERRDFIKEYLLSEKISWSRKIVFFSYLDNNESDLMEDLDLHQELLPFLSALAADPGISQKLRLDLLRDLAENGRPELLLKYYEDLERDGSVEDENRYQFSKDMCICGRAEYMDGLRGEWLEKGDVEVLELFEKFGTLKDIAELEKSREEGAPESMVQKAIEAIKARS